MLMSELVILRYAVKFPGSMKHHGVAISFLLAAVAISAQVRGTPVAVNGRVPLGIETFRLEPAKRDFYLMASAENPMFVGMRRVTGGDREELLNANGKAVTVYPERVQFRLTASSRAKLLDDKPFDTNSPLTLDQLLDQLRFRLKVFHGLTFRYIEPAFVEDVGMPRNMPYDERIYRIGFDMGKIPIQDRVVMEVLTPSGQRLCKFHLDLL
jgi:hypothetical protein